MEGGTSPSKIITSGKTLYTVMPTEIPFGSTILAWTIPLARKAEPDGFILISLMVTFRRSCGRGVGAGNLVSIQRLGIRGVETVTVLSSLER